MYEPDRRCTVRVVSAMPLLEVAFHDFPSRLMENEVRCVQMTLSNRGHQTMSRVRLRVSHPEYFFIAPLTSTSAALPGQQWGAIVGSGEPDTRCYTTQNQHEFLCLPCPYDILMIVHRLMCFVVCSPVRAVQ